VYAVKLPASATFAGEEVPLDDPEVRERLDRELTVNSYWHSSTIFLLKRANRFFPVIEPILKEEGIPDDFKYVCMAESGFDNVVSPSGAAGFWQFLKTTGAIYGLVINTEVDERYNLEKATRAACKYFNDAKNQTGSWTAAAASYNMGTAGVLKQQTNQQESAYYHLFLNSETSRYVQRIIALKMVHQHPKDFGYNLGKEDLYQPFQFTLEDVSGTVSWVEFAKSGFTIPGSAT
jgi:membrane-bound lytic murein transglycosylase D